MRLRIAGALLSLSLAISPAESAVSAAAKTLASPAARGVQAPAPAIAALSLKPLAGSFVPLNSLSAASPIGLPNLLPALNAVQAQGTAQAASVAAGALQAGISDGARQGAALSAQSPPAAALREIARSASPVLEAIAGPASNGALHGAGERLQEILGGGFHRALSDAPLISAAAALGPDLSPALSGKLGEPALGPPPPRAGAAPIAQLGGFLALLPSSAWAQLFPIALAAAFLLGLIYYDFRSQGRLSRRFQEFFSARTLSRNVERDAEHLFSFPRDREKDRDTVKDFLRAWSSAHKSRKTSLIRDASTSALWRQLLASAYLAERSPEVRKAIQEALAKSPRLAMEPLDAVLMELFERRQKELPWLQEGEALGRLLSLMHFVDWSRGDYRRQLGELLDHPNESLRAGAAKLLGEESRPRPHQAKALIWRLGTVLSGLALAASLGLALAAAVGAWNHRELQTQSSSRNFADFWGEDSYIFTSSYGKDPNIPRKILPFLSRWRDLTEEDSGEFTRALELLRASVDPGSENVLEAIFKRIDFLPHTPEAEELLITTLIERQNESIWQYMRRRLLELPRDETILGRFRRMAQIGPKIGGDRVFQNVFYFHKEDYFDGNPAIRSITQEAVRTSLNDPARAPKYLERLNDLGKRYLRDSELQLWVEKYLLNPLANPKYSLSEENVKTAQEILNRVLDAEAADDAWRVRAFAVLRPGQERLLGPLNQEESLLELKSRLQHRPAADSWLAKAALWQSERLTAGLVSEAKKLFPDLSEKLHERRVLKFSGAERSSFKLVHLRELRSILKETAAQPDLIRNPAQREFLNRAGILLGHVLEVARQAGTPEGSSAGEMAADDINEILPSAENIFRDSTFLDALADSGLRMGGTEPRLQSYSLEQIRALQSIVLEFMTEGQTRDRNYKEEEESGEPGPLRPLSPSERKTLADLREDLDLLADRYYPGRESALARAQSVTPGRRMPDLKSADQAVRSAADKDLRAMLNAREELFLPLLDAAFRRHAKDADIAAWVLDVLTERLAGPRGGEQDVSLSKSILQNAVQALDKAGQFPDTLAILEKAVQTRPSELLAFLIAERIQEEAKKIVQEAQSAYPGLESKLVTLDVHLPPRWSNTGSRERHIYAQRHLTNLLKAVREEAAGSKTALAPRQKDALKHADEVLPSLLRLAQKAKLPGGFSIEERAADKVNPVLYEGYWPFAIDLWVQELRARKFAPPASRFWSGIDSDLSFAPRYSKQELRALLDFVKDFQKQGQGWESKDGKYQRRPFSDAEKKYVEEAIVRLERVLAEFYPPGLTDNPP